MNIKTPADLKAAVENAGHDQYYFTRDSMKFFGDTMRNYGIINHPDYIELYRKRPVKHGLFSSAYFCNKTFKRLFNIKETTECQHT